MHPVRLISVLGLAMAAVSSPASLAAANDAPDRQAAIATLLTQARFTGDLEGVQKAIDAGKDERALQLAEDALTLQPDNPLAINARGAALVQLGRYDEATTTFEKVLAIDPNFFQAEYNQGEILFLQKKFADAAIQYRLMMNKYGESPVLKFKLFLSYLLGGQTGRAAEMLALIRYPLDGPAWYYAHAADLLQSGETSRAHQLLSTANALHASDGTLYRVSLTDAGILK